MEQGNNIANNVDMDMDSTMEEIKAKLIDDVNVELELRGIKIEPTNYDYGQNIYNILNKYKEATIKRDIEAERIQARYSPNVAGEMMKMLNEDYKLEVDSLLYDLDQVAQDDIKWRNRQLENKMADPNYLEAKKVSMDTLVMLKGLDVPNDVIEDVIGPLVEVGDVKALRLAQVLLGDEKTEAGRRVGRTLNVVRGQLENYESKPFIDEAKKYISSHGKDVGVVLFGLMKKYDKR